MIQHIQKLQIQIFTYTTLFTSSTSHFWSTLHKKLRVRHKNGARTF